MKMKWDMAEIHSKIPSVPAYFADWAREQFYGGYNIYVGNVEFYNDLGFSTKRRMAYCSHCRQYFDATKEIKAGKKAMCTVCSNYSTVYGINSKRNPTKMYETMWLGQNIGDGIFVLRGFRVEYVQNSPVFVSRDDPADEAIMNETRRLYIAPKGWYTEYSAWVIGDQGYWRRGWYHAAGEHTNCEGPVYPSTYKEIKGTAAEYAFIEMAEEKEIYFTDENWNYSWGPEPWRRYSIWDYLFLYAKDRKTEMLLKLGIEELIKHRMAGCKIGHNWRAKNPWDYLRIYKSRMKDLEETENKVKMLKILQMERESMQHWDETERDIMLFLYSRDREMKQILQYQTITQFVNRVKTYEQRNRQQDRNHIIITYIDYLTMKERLGFDMTKSIYQFPRDLQAAHDRAHEDLYTKDEKKKAQIKDRQFKNIKKRFANANKIYTWEHGTLLIRPAKSASEIVDEGRLLHHCVGGDNYLKKHNEGIDIILFIRKKKKQEEPYITVEIDPEGHIIQWYGKCDTKPDEKKINKWLNEYLAVLDKKAIKREMKRQKKGATA